MNAIELKPCKCGSTDIKMRLAVQRNGKGAYCYQCKECGKMAYAWTESKDMAVEVWNDTVK